MGELKRACGSQYRRSKRKAFRHFVQLSGHKKCNLIVVFDAYRVKGHQTEMLDHHNIHVVYTKEAETADAYIEKVCT